MENKVNNTIKCLNDFKEEILNICTHPNDVIKVEDVIEKVKQTDEKKKGGSERKEINIYRNQKTTQVINIYIKQK